MIDSKFGVCYARCDKCNNDVSMENVYCEDCYRKLEGRIRELEDQLKDINLDLEIYRRFYERRNV